ncbi:MAG: tRNA guanosine(34) transglycosylase Tgt [Bacteroidetes bacterium]|nr:tRNA guanosine(34) transglycosylase Tgt [Bacteroidota bacterium]
MKFRIEHTNKETKARAGEIETARGKIQTPVFMPVGTRGTVKAVHQHELKDDIGAQIILGNTYHLYLKPGIDVIEKAGGLHKFIGWDLPMLTDSGGFQIFSLGDERRKKNPDGFKLPKPKISEEGVKFVSEIDGSTHFFSPEKAIDVQRSIGADIIMAFDECTPYPCEYTYAKESMDMTHRWLKRCKKRFDETAPLYPPEGGKFAQALFPIVQGSVYKDLRIQSAEFISSMNFEGNAIGGLSVGEEEEEMFSMAEIVCGILPKEKPRYLMGVGTPAQLLECIALGIDMFDCVMPTRNARNGMLFTSQGTISIRNAKYKDDFSAIDENGTSFVDKNYSKAYLRHLNMADEMLASQIASIHNLAFYASLMREARKKIIDGTFSEWKNKTVKQLNYKL